MLKRIGRHIPAAVALIGVVLVFSGVSMMEQTATDLELYPYIARAFAGLALMIAGVVVNLRRQ